MEYYQKQIRSELSVWQMQMLQRPSLVNWLSKKVQVKINTWIPEKVHQAITSTIKQMIRGVLFGATHTTAKPLLGESFQECEAAVLKRIEFYKNTAAVEGGITGAGGILLGLADFPILIGLKLKLLFDISSMYGFDVTDYKERVYLLHIFELAFSSHEHRRKIYLKMVDWDKKSLELPEDIHQFDWRNFQQEYRDSSTLQRWHNLYPS